MTDLTTSYDGARPIEDFVPSKTNPRTHFDEAYIADLKFTIAEKGVIEPLVARPHPKQTGKIEIVAGECRWRASKLAALTVLPVVIRNYSDEQVLEIQLIENIHRKDLTALEQAVGYRKLIASNPTKHSAATIATRIGMSVEWVWDTLSLNNLVPDVLQLLEDGRIARGHAVLIAREKPDVQLRIIKPPTRTWPKVNSGLWEEDEGFDFEPAEGQKKSKYDDLKPKSIRELERWIADNIRFDVEHAAKAQPLAFEQTKTLVEIATNAPGRGKKMVWITHDYRVGDAARSDDERTYGSESWKRADGQAESKTCEYSVLGVVAAGEDRGQSLQVCVNRDKCKVHFAESVRAKEKAATLRAGGNTKKAAKVEKKAEDNWQVKQAREQKERTARESAWKAIGEHVIADAVGQVKAIKTLTPKLAAALLKDGEYGLDGDVLKKHLGAHWFKTPVAALLVNAVAYFTYSGWNTKKSGFQEYTETVAKNYGLDLKRLEAIRDKHAPKKAESEKPTAKKKAS